jgi:hypothetical protein
MIESVLVTLRSSFTPYVVETKSFLHQHAKRSRAKTNERKRGDA